jgi:peptidoglycan/xylan/chitin deacetylase (PgdA/CDA1 family)
MAIPLSRIVSASLVGFVLGTSVWGTSARGSSAPRRAFVPVLIYHHVKWLKPADDAIERGLTVLPTQFAAELSYLTRVGYHTVTASRLVSYLRGGRALPRKPVVLTFDDGYADIYSDVYLELIKRNMLATFFIVPGFLNTARYLTWRQVEIMAAHGMDIEAHSMTHPDLTIVNDGQLTREVSESRQELQTNIHRPVRVFAYPYGAFDNRVETALIRAGFYASFTTRQGWWETADRLLVLPRVYVDLDDTPRVFEGRLVANAGVLAHDPT